jgi:Protein of unknown function (DUF3499)
MSERREVGHAKRQCARFGCTAIATATYTFDSDACIVYVDVLDDGGRTFGLSAGELCSRHARSLRPPRGWQLEDRRPSENAPPPQLAAGPTDVGLEDELRHLFDARTPLLARAFRSSGTV